MIIKSGKRDSNSRPSAWEADALPTELLPRLVYCKCMRCVYFVQNYFSVHFIDQMQRSVLLPAWPPRRIVSLVPSQTELLADLGLEEQVVGITKFCIHPNEWFQSKNRVGGTKTLNMAKIAQLMPDLIIGNKEENERDQIAALATLYPVWMSDIQNLDDAIEMIQKVGALCDRSASANALALEIKTEFQRLEKLETLVTLTAAYLIWRKPYMVAGNDTFIQEMLWRAGFKNAFEDKTRYPEVSLSDLAATQPDVVFLSSEPYPFAEKHLLEIRNACPKATVLLVDGELFSWYGSRLKLTPAYFQQLRKLLE